MKELRFSLKKFRNKFFYCLLISLLIHSVFLLWSYFIKIRTHSAEIHKEQRFMHVKISKEEREGKDVRSPEDSPREKSDQPENPLADMAAFSDFSVDTPEAVQEKLSAGVEKDSRMVAEPSEQEVHRFEKQETYDVDTSHKVLRAPRRHLVNIGELPQKDFTAGSPVVVAGQEISRDFLDKSRLALKKDTFAAVELAQSRNEFRDMKRYSPGIERKARRAELGAVLTYELHAYEDPSDGQKYFRLSVKVKDATVALPVIPKEIVFIIDASKSIGEERLKEFREGLAYSLNNLNPDDRFNIIVFKDKTLYFRHEPIKPEPKNIQEALAFLDNLKAASKTDVYGALSESIEGKETFEPSYRILLSDGFPTEGVTNTRQVINEISKLNDGKVSIFTFSGGVGISRYLLDFVAYKNRGWAQYAEREHFIDRDLARMYQGIKDPLLLKLRYYVSGINENQIFPQILPDFFKGSEFVVYGRYDSENKFFMQLLGDLKKETKEFTIQAALEEASPGDPSIARQWAFHKIYHLIGQLQHNEKNELIIQEIDQLTKKFNIETPYSKNYR